MSWERDLKSWERDKYFFSHVPIVLPYELIGLVKKIDYMIVTSHTIF